LKIKKNRVSSYLRTRSHHHLESQQRGRERGEKMGKIVDGKLAERKRGVG